MPLSETGVDTVDAPPQPKEPELNRIQRGTQIGVRVAIGASRSDVLRLLFRDSLTPVAMGISAGAIVALLAGQALAGMLYGVGSRDPLAFGAAISILIVSAAIAVWIPARRAARVDRAFVLAKRRRYSRARRHSVTPLSGRGWVFSHGRAKHGEKDQAVAGGTESWPIGSKLSPRKPAFSSGPVTRIRMTSAHQFKPRRDKS